LSVELRLAQLRLEQKLPRRRLSAEKVSLQSCSCAEQEFASGPNTFVVEIRDGATSTIARESCLAAIRIEDAATEVGFVTLQLADDRDAIATSAVVSIADAASELTEIAISDLGELFCFEYEVVVSQPVEFRESLVHLASQLPGAGHHLVESLSQCWFDIQQAFEYR